MKKLIIIIAMVLSFTPYCSVNTYAQNPDYGSGSWNRRYTQPRGHQGSYYDYGYRYYYRRQTPYYYGYYPRYGYYRQYNNYYYQYSPGWQELNQPYMRCSQTDYYYNLCK